MKRYLSICSRIIFLIFILDLSIVLLCFTLGTVEFPEGKRRKVDVGVILMGDFNSDQQSIGPESQRRIEQAYRLYQAGLFEQIICAGGARPQQNIYGAEYMKQALVQQGVPAGKIIADRQSNNSQGNLEQAVRMMQENGFSSMYLISSPLHLSRVKKLFLSSVPENIVIEFAPYSYKVIRPQAHYLELWRQIHYEWIAYLLHRVLPVEKYHDLIDWLRG